MTHSALFQKSSFKWVYLWGILHKDQITQNYTGKAFANKTAPNQKSLNRDY